MKISLLALSLLAGTALSVSAVKAADLIVDDMAIAAASPSKYDWSGVYFGAQVGWIKATAPEVPNCNTLNDDYFEEDYGFNSDFSLANFYGDGHTFYSSSCDVLYDSIWDYWYGPVMNFDDDYIVFTEATTDNSLEGFSFGGQVGINQQFGDFVLGLEASVVGVTGIERNSYAEFDYYHNTGPSYDGTFSIEAIDKLDWLATFRGRAGMALGDEGNILAYGTGGVALAHVTSTINTDAWNVDQYAGWCDGCGWGPGDGTVELWQPGFVVGAGVEYGVTENITIGAEYLYVGLVGQQEQSVTLNGDDGRAFDVTRTAGFDNVQSLSLKLNFKF